MDKYTPPFQYDYALGLFVDSEGKSLPVRDAVTLLNTRPSIVEVPEGLTYRERAIIKFAVWQFMNFALSNMVHAAQKSSGLTQEAFDAFAEDARVSEALVAKLRTLWPASDSAIADAASKVE